MSFWKNRTLARPVALALALLLAVVVLAAVIPTWAAPDAPTAVRVRVAHVAPYPGSSAKNVTVTVDGSAVATNLGYGDRTDYQLLAVSPGGYTVEVLRGGTSVFSGTVSFIDGDQSLLFIGVEPLPLTVWHVDDAFGGAPPSNRGYLRFGHVAAIGTTADATKVDVCAQDGTPFQAGADPLRYLRLTGDKQLPAVTYDLKMTRDSDLGQCSGDPVIDPPPWTLPGGASTTFYLVGDGVNQDLSGFTFADGLVGADPRPIEQFAYFPAVIK